MAPAPDWFDLVQKGGTYTAPLLLAAILWLNADRGRLLAELKSRDEKLESLAERWLVVVTELRTFLFNERKSS